MAFKNCVLACRMPTRVRKSCLIRDENNNWAREKKTQSTNRNEYQFFFRVKMLANRVVLVRKFVWTINCFATKIEFPSFQQIRLNDKFLFLSTMPINRSSFGAKVWSKHMQMTHHWWIYFWNSIQLTQFITHKLNQRRKYWDWCECLFAVC